MKIGTIVKLSEAGLDYLYADAPRKIREKAEKLRYEYRGHSKQYDDVVIVKRLTSNSWLNFHKTFIKPPQ